ncbi:hypothetical protein Pfo_007773 [Paulownia fortunei]|nr:hypothetical protein Pfo_007773 [Paulownia fortunei]
MADIAILVAEEYERRVKMSRESGEEIELLSCVGVLGQSFKGSSSSSWIKEKLILMKEEKMVGILGKGGLEPKSQMSLAASNGFFSA